MLQTSPEERKIYAAICTADGLKAKDIAKRTGIDRSEVNRLLYASPYMRELCYRDDAFLWRGLIRQAVPHTGLEAFSGWFGTVGDLLSEPEELWFSELCAGCERIGRNLNDTRGLFHSFRDCRAVMQNLFDALREVGFTGFENWELCFELRLNRARYIRIYADVLLITENRVFSLEFKMKDVIDPAEAEQAAKYCGYLEVLFGAGYDVIPALVLTKAADLYTYTPLRGTEAELPVCSGDMLFNLIDEYIGVFEN